MVLRNRWWKEYVLHQKGWCLSFPLVYLKRDRGRPTVDGGSSELSILISPWPSLTTTQCPSGSDVTPTATHRDIDVRSDNWSPNPTLLRLTCRMASTEVVLLAALVGRAAWRFSLTTCEVRLWPLAWVVYGTPWVLEPDVSLVCRYFRSLKVRLPSFVVTTGLRSPLSSLKTVSWQTDLVRNFRFRFGLDLSRVWNN